MDDVGAALAEDRHTGREALRVLLRCERPDPERGYSVSGTAYLELGGAGEPPAGGKARSGSSATMS